MPDTITLTRQADQWGGIEPDEFGRVFDITYTGALADPDGNVIVKGVKHRRPIEPDADVSKESAVIKAAAAEARTPERLARFEAIKAREAAKAEAEEPVDVSRR